MASDPTLYGPGHTQDDLARTAHSEKAKTDEAPKVDPLVAMYWREIERYNRAVTDWYQEGEEIENVYLDEDRANKHSARRFAMLWANVETLKPAVYTKPPVMVCSRRFKDRDPTARIAAELIERASNTSFDLYGVDEIFKGARDDRLIAGRGTAWVRYEAELDRHEDGTDEKGEPKYREKLKSEHVCVDYVHWKDFGHNVARTWKDVWLVWRICYKTQDEVSERFGSKVAANLTYNAVTPAYGAAGGKDDPDGRCKIFELWDKTRRKVSWLVEGHKTFVESGPPPIEFRDGFPCPEPMYATKTAKQMIPTPDYRYYRDQAKEINDLTDKIGNMCQWLIVKGFVPGAPSGVADPLEEALRDKGNKEMFQSVDSFMEWSEKGGTKGIIDWFPIEAVVKAIEAAITVRAQLVQDVFQITGVSDILRGQTDPSETLGAQELKAQTGSRRLKNAKDDIARFCRDVGRLTAEVIAEKFEPETIAAMTGYKYVTPEMQQQREMQKLMAAQAQQQQQQPMMMGGPEAPNVTPMPGVSPMMPPRPPMGHNGGPQMSADNDDDESLEFTDEVMAVLRSDKLRNFRIEIETDSTVQADEQAEKQGRVEFTTMAGQYLKQAVEVIGMAPDLAPAVGELMMFTARAFHVGRSVEETLEKSFKAASDRVKQAAANPQPDPKIQIEQEKAKIQGQVAMETLKLKAQESQQNMQFKAQEAQMDMAIKKQEADLDMAVATQKAQTDQAVAQQKASTDMAVAQQDMQVAQAQSAIELRNQQAKGEQELRQGQQKHEQASRHADESAKQKAKAAAMAPKAKKPA